MEELSSVYLQKKMWVRKAFFGLLFFFFFVMEDE